MRFNSIHVIILYGKLIKTRQLVSLKGRLMDHRIFFVAGDLIANLLVGALVGLVSAIFVGVGWNMLLAMILAMMLGMLIGGLTFFPLSLLFGAMEVMLPAMLTGMISGMIVGMRGTMHSMTPYEGAAIGGLCGLVCILIIWVINSRLRGVKSHG